MKRRRFLGGLVALACPTCVALAQPSTDYKVPGRFTRPAISTDEGGLWSQMDREEKQYRRSPFTLQDEKLRSYVQDVACRLGADHCPDIRVYLIRTPLFNASMAPNGMMQVWTGLLLRVENEAQLAAVLGHEIGHYLQRHSVERLRDVKTRAAWMQFMALFGAVGLVGQMATLASMFGYSRDQEREADRIGAVLMHAAGYDVREAARVWENLILEARARDGKEVSRSSPMFATHPAEPERQATLEKIAGTLQGGNSNKEQFAAMAAPYLAEWTRDEIKRAQFAESLVLFNRHIEQATSPGLMHYARGEVYRTRNAAGDQELALADFQEAIAAPAPPPEAYRGIGLISRSRGQKKEAAEALGHYLELVPDAADAAFMKSYIAELSS